MSSLLEYGQQQFQQQLAKAFGQDFVDFIPELQKVTDKLQKDTGSKDLQNGYVFDLPLVAVEHKTRPDPKSDPSLVEDDIKSQIKLWANFADAAYAISGSKSDDDQVSKRLAKSLPDSFLDTAKDSTEIKKAGVPGGKSTVPGYFVAVDRRRRAVVLTIRGEIAVSDLAEVVLDDPGTFKEYELGELKVQTHKKLLEHCRDLVKDSLPVLNAALEADAGFGLVCTGHGLGATAAILCALLLQKSELKTEPYIRCFAYGPAPVISDPESNYLIDFPVEIIVVVNKDDAVPRLDLYSAYVLGKEVAAVDSLDIDTRSRFDIIQKVKDGTEIEAAQKEQIVAAVADASKALADEKTKPYSSFFLPGFIFWVDPDVPEQPLIGESDLNDFTQLILRPGSFEDHKIEKYLKNLKHLPPPTVTFPEDIVLRKARSDCTRDKCCTVS